MIEPKDWKNLHRLLKYLEKRSRASGKIPREEAMLDYFISLRRAIKFMGHVSYIPKHRPKNRFKEVERVWHE